MNIETNIQNTKYRPEDIQGNIVRGYNFKYVRHLILEVSDVKAARRFLAASVSDDSGDVPSITRETSWKKKPESCFNIGFTYEGLKALGLSRKQLASFPKEFVEGMTKRALKIGDFGESAPETWPAPFDQPDRVHIVASVHAKNIKSIDGIQDIVARSFNVIGVRDGRALDKGKIVFGYVDGISQPKLKHVHDPSEDKDDQPINPLGVVLLGYPTRLEGVLFSLPQPEKELGFNGTFNAFRVLSQNAAEFETYLTEAAEDLLKHKDIDHL
ncbi:MAG: hypothetical protein EX271_11025, partial [Acidimicrobiales bacterium]